MPETETPTAAPEEDLDDPETPLAAPEVAPVAPVEEDLDDGETPLAAPASASWALLNLVLALFTVLASVLLFVPTGKKRRNRSGSLRLVSLVPALGALVAFILTEDMRLSMAITDRWTLLMVMIALVQLGVCIVAKKAQDNSNGRTAARA